MAEKVDLEEQSKKELDDEFRGDDDVPEKPKKVSLGVVIVSLMFMGLAAWFFDVMVFGDNATFDAMHLPSCQGPWSVDFTGDIGMGVDDVVLKVDKNGTTWFDGMKMAEDSSHGRALYRCVLANKKSAAMKVVRKAGSY